MGIIILLLHIPDMSRSTPKHTEKHAWRHLTAKTVPNLKHTLPSSDSRKHCEKCRKHDADDKRAERAQTKMQNNSAKTGQKRVRENEAITEEEPATRQRIGASKNTSRRANGMDTDEVDGR